MPRKAAIKATQAKKTKRTKRTKSHPKTKFHNTSTANRLVDLLNNISNNRRGLTKTELNLPARLMQNGSKTLSPAKSLTFSKSVSSSYSTTMHNGNVHSAGKQVINDSTKPYIQVSELHNGQIAEYMIPRNQSRMTMSKKSKKSSKSSKS